MSSIKKFTTEELEAELLLRKHGDLPLKDWYFIEGEDDDDEKRVVVLIIHKRTWHLTHSTDDGVYDYIIREKLPKGFHEIMESTFEYKPKHLLKKNEPEGTSQEAFKLLEMAGATRIKKPFWGSNFYHAVKFVGHNDYFRVEGEADTPKIKQDVLAWLKEYENNYATPERYYEAFKTWAKKKQLHLEEFEYIYDNTKKVALISKKVWNKLPPAITHEDQE